MTSLQVVALLALTPAVGGDAKAGWETLKGMAGEWSGIANDGRKIRHSVQLIAGDSVLMERSWFEAHPGQMMVTMYHLDKDKLVLTHYCVAKNQPRLEATDISADGKKLLFTFRDGTNLASRNAGHMDKAEYTFLNKDTFKSRWTWYQEGKERWMEEFTFHRDGTASVAKSEIAAGPSASGCCGS